MSTKNRITQIDENTWRVLGSTGNPYTVRRVKDGYTCTCRETGGHCPHIAAVGGPDASDVTELEATRERLRAFPGGICPNCRAYFEDGQALQSMRVISHEEIECPMCGNVHCIPDM